MIKGPCIRKTEKLKFVRHSETKSGSRTFIVHWSIHFVLDSYTKKNRH